jgi:dihydroxyacetone kinase-like protein
VNGLGATPLDEQYIVTRRIDQFLKEKGKKPIVIMLANMYIT